MTLYPITKNISDTKEFMETITGLFISEMNSQCIYI
jgi:hypothetical protein